LSRNPIPDDQHVHISRKDKEEEEARKYTEEEKHQILYEYHDDLWESIKESHVF